MVRFLTLQEVCEKIVDCPHETPKWQKKGIPVIRNFNLIDGRIDFSDGYYVDEDTYMKRTKREIPREGDIVFSREAPIGNCAIIPNDFKCCLGQRIVLLRVNKKICSSEYLLTVLLSDYVKKQIEQVSKRGSIVSNFNIGDLGNLVIPILENQDKIADLSTIILNKIILNNKLSKELESIVKTIYDYWFLQYEFQNEEGKPYKSTGGKMVYNEKIKKEIPEGWKVTTIGKIIIERQKSSIKVGQAKNKLGKYPFFTSGSEIYEMNEFLTDGRNCFLSTGGKGYVQYYVGKSSYSTDTWVISGINNLEDYLYLFIKSIENMLDNKYFAGTGLQHLQKDLFKDTHIVIPSDEILKEFNKISNTIFNKISRIYKENKELQKLRDFLLPLLMNEQVGFKS